MTFKQDDNSGALFPNQDRKNDKSPTSKGSCTIDGKEYWVAGWTKTSKSGSHFMSLSFTLKDARQEGSNRPKKAEPQPEQGQYEDELSDPLPF